jgi:hypothetical protein
VLPITPVWSVAAGGGTISATGLFTAGTTAGTYINTVTATSGAIAGTATVTVTATAGPLATITVTPNPASVPATTTRQFTAVGKDAAGNIVAVTPVWSVAAGGGTISATGLFTAGAATGTYANTVTATSGAIAGTATVTVTAAPGPLAAITVMPDPATVPLGGMVQFTAVGKDAAGNTLTIAPVWAVVAGGGTISAGGQFTADVTPGTFANTVMATTGAVSGMATVIVQPGPLATITVTPNPASVPATTTQQFSAVGKDAAGNIVAITPVWSVAAGGGTMGTTGLFTAGSTTGTFTNTVTATSGGVAGTATVMVTAAPGALATITVTPNPASVPATSAQQFTAVGKDADGKVVAITPVWSVAAGGGTINTSGVFTAGATTGTFSNTVTASSGGIVGTATVMVTAAPGTLVSITVTPNPATVKVGGMVQFSAVGRDASGVVVPFEVHWHVAAGGGTINDPGVFVAGQVPGTFTNTVVASGGNVSGSATVVVTGSSSRSMKP